MSKPLTMEIGFHPSMGPGGILWRWIDHCPWSSMASQSASGLEAFEWPIRLIAQCDKRRLRYAIVDLEPVIA
jgi:hypothetical protein